jgi:hypothetical protein
MCQQSWVAHETMVQLCPHKGQARVGRCTNEDDVQVGLGVDKGDVWAWCKTNKGCMQVCCQPYKGSVHKARWDAGKRCQVARGMGVWTADAHHGEWGEPHLVLSRGHSCSNGVQQPHHAKQQHGQDSICSWLAACGNKTLRYFADMQDKP